MVLEETRVAFIGINNRSAILYEVLFRFAGFIIRKYLGNVFLSMFGTEENSVVRPSIQPTSVFARSAFSTK